MLRLEKICNWYLLNMLYPDAYTYRAVYQIWAGYSNQISEAKRYIYIYTLILLSARLERLGPRNHLCFSV